MERVASHWFLSGCLGWLLLTSLSSAADWPQFLGPERNGTATSEEAALPDSYPGSIEPLWEWSVGSGWAGPVVKGDRLIIFHREGSDMVTEALDIKTGKSVWRNSYITDYIDSFGFDNGPRATPAIAGDRIFLYGPEGRVTALDFKTGKELWAYDTASAVNSEAGFFGRAPSPLVVDDKVIIAAGGVKEGQPAGLIALEAASGKLLWQSVEDEAGYASPVSMPDAPGQILAWMRNDLWQVTTTGKVLFHERLRSSMDASVNAATPIPCGKGRWLITAEYGVGASLFSPDAAGLLSRQWNKRELINAHYSTPLYWEDCVYGFDGRQESGQTLRCVDLVTAKVRWDSPRLPGGTLLRVKDKLVVITEQGEAWIVRATPEKFEQLGVFQILRAGHRSHAAFSDGVLYARDSEQLVAVKLR